MNEDKATRYHRLRRRAQVASVLSAGVTLALVAFAGGHALRALAEALASGVFASPAARWWGGVACSAGLLALLLDLAVLPASFYSGLVLGRRYGLSRQSPASWWRDHLKGIALGTAMMIVVALVVYGAMTVAARTWWLLAGAGLAGLAALLAVAAPVLIFPLFYRFEPLPDGDLPRRLTTMAARAGAPVIGVYEWVLGEKSRTANAALAGMGPTRRILLSDTLLKEYSVDEIEVVIAHELAHHVHGDIWRGVALEALSGTLALLVGHLALIALGPWVGVAGPADVAGMPLLVLAAGGASLGLAPLLLAASRRHERRADRFALDLTAKPEAFVSAMRRLGAQNLADQEPTRLVEWLFHSHPPMAARIASARRWALEHETPIVPA